MNKDNINLLIAVLLSALVMILWQKFFNHHEVNNKNLSHHTQTLDNSRKHVDKMLPREAAVNNSRRVQVQSNLISGSISTQGVRIDDIVLNKYKEYNTKDSDNIKLLSPSNSRNSYFIEFGWHGSDNFDIPNANTKWKIIKNDINNGGNLELSWKNKQGVQFQCDISILDDYLLRIKQSVFNKTRKELFVQNYGLINRVYDKNAEQESSRALSMVHRGAISTVDGKLDEYSYDNLKKKHITKDLSSVEWLGFTDKYWLTSVIPGKTNLYFTNYTQETRDMRDVYQIDFLSQDIAIKAGDNFAVEHKVFVGPKKLKLLDKYSDRYNIKLFDRSIDFGWLYLITKPIFNLMNFIYAYFGNFGISIILVTVIIKIAMFSLSNKSYRSISKMKAIQPKLDALKEKYSNDKVRLQQEIIALYKRESVNPVSGCLPILLQIPIFFAIYKVLAVTIEMRHAPFFLWVKDLSAPDTANLGALFSYFNITIPQFLNIGLWSCIMSFTMLIQQKFNTQPSDPNQAFAMKMMPLFFLFIFNGFPVGLLIYWSFSNLLSILQQIYINHREQKEHAS